MEGNGQRFDSFTVEKTLALVTPDIIKLGPQIKSLIIENGFEILAERNVALSSEETAEFYTEHYNKEYFNELVNAISGKDLLIMCIAKNNAVADWLKLIGITQDTETMGTDMRSLKAYFDESYSNANKPYELIHGSRNSDAAMREIHFFFPTMITDVFMINGKPINEYLSGNENPILLEGLQELCKKQPEDPIVWLADWLLMHNPKEKQ